MTELSCVVHVHSTYSDGTASVPELLETARDAGVDAVLLTDHDTLAGRVTMTESSCWSASR